MRATLSGVVLRLPQEVRGHHRRADLRMVEMVSSAQASRSAALNEQMLIMRIITSVGLALLLMFGLAATAHSESTASTTLPLVVSGISDPHVETSRDASPGEYAAVTGDTGSGSDALIGAALCVFGLLCGLTFVVLLRKSWQQRMPPALGSEPRVTSLLPASAARANPVVFSLTQLGLSRT